MDVVHAIAKVRFGSAKAQRIGLCQSAPLSAELICMEAGQKFKVDSGQWLYYVIAGSAALTAGAAAHTLASGQMAMTAQDEPHTLACAGETRLICLATCLAKS